MFKSGRWKGQNSKINVMFQLQFQATQVPKMKGKGLMIALIPAETGKPIAKLARTPIVDGTVTWAEPIYELVKLVRNQKTETYKEKIYYFNVQTGSSKSGFVGEVGVDFANFAETTEPFQLSLPLTAESTGAILHVFIQKMQRTDESRELEENESLQSESVKSRNQASDYSENGNSNATSKNGGENIVKQRSITDWSLGSLSDKSIADLLNSPEENHTEGSKDDVHALKSEVSRLERQAELAEMELESLRKQISKEKKRSQDLSNKFEEIKEEKEDLEMECDELRKDLKQEKSYRKSNNELAIAVKDFERKLEEKDKEISQLSEDIENMYVELEREKKEKEELKIHIEDITVDYKYLLQENDDMSSKSLTTVKEYELQVKRLEEKIMDQALEISKSLDTNAELETHIDRLEKELEKQGHDFEDDVQDLMKAKIEQEERVVQAEEALRKSTLTNAAVLEKANQELLLLKDAHKQEVQKLYDQIDQQEEQIERMSMELEACRKTGENNGDLEEWVRERETLVAEVESLKKESTSWTSLMSEKNVVIRTLKSELKVLRGDHNQLQQRLLVIESEKDNLQKEVSRLDQENRKLAKESKAAFNASTSKHDESRSKLESGKSNEGRCSEQKLNKLLSEISALNEKNKHMENELKEMQEKYSEVSLRFAEVEGERQELVMALRNLRNGKGR
ncbi:putative NT-type C2 domain-containing protein [Helianthus annuus]|nr:putative NT-type C2 domain-containing protein [Helianthus annuus]